MLNSLCSLAVSMTISVVLLKFPQMCARLWHFNEKFLEPSFLKTAINTTVKLQSANKTDNSLTNSKSFLRKTCFFGPLCSGLPSVETLKKC